MVTIIVDKKMPMLEAPSQTGCGPSDPSLLVQWCAIRPACRNKIWKQPETQTLKKCIKFQCQWMKNENCREVRQRWPCTRLLMVEICVTISLHGSSTTTDLTRRVKKLHKKSYLKDQQSYRRKTITIFLPKQKTIIKSNDNVMNQLFTYVWDQFEQVLLLWHEQEMSTQIAFY